MAIHVDRLGRYFNRSTSYYNLGRYEDAIYNFSLAADLDASHPDVFAYRGPSWLDGMQAAQQTIADCDRALALDPDYAPALMLRAEAWRLQGDRARARADEQRAEQLSPGITETWRGSSEEEQEAE